MKVNKHYNTPDRKANDEAALLDIKSYFGKNVKAWEALLFECGRAEENGQAGAFQNINIALSFAGIEGYPVHAIGRTYCRTAYKAWMAEGGVETDAEGWKVEAPDAKG